MTHHLHKQKQMRLVSSKPHVKAFDSYCREYESNNDSIWVASTDI